MMIFWLVSLPQARLGRPVILYLGDPRAGHDVVNLPQALRLPVAETVFHCLFSFFFFPVCLIRDIAWAPFPLQLEHVAEFVMEHVTRPPAPRRGSAMETEQLDDFEMVSALEASPPT
jgi:hypothetical protein